MRRLLSLLAWGLLAPGSLIEAELRCRRFGKRYDSVHLPSVVDGCGPDDDPWRKALAAGTRSYAIRVAFFIDNFSRMAGGAFDLEGALYCGMFGNLYDQVIDAQTLPPHLLPTLIADMRAGCYRKHELCEVRLMNALYQHVWQRFPDAEYPLFHQTVDRLHRLQVRSLAQLGPAATLDEIVEVTREKGAAATLIFCAACKPGLSPDEIAAIEEMGAFFQFMDDYEDRRIDRLTGLRTAFTAGGMNGASLRRMLCDSIAHVERVFPPSPARASFVRGLVSWYALALVDACFKRVGIPEEKILQRLLAMGHLLPTQSRN